MSTAATRAAFEEFLERGARGRRWQEWADLFTDDAVYTEHCLGRFVGKPAITAWITKAMEPVACMTFSVEWAAVEGDLVAFWIWNHLPAPDGDDRAFCFPNMSVLTHAGDGRFSAEEDFYEPAWTNIVIDWFRAGGKPTMTADPSLVPPTPTHPRPPSSGPERSVAAAALVAAAPAGARWRQDVIEGPTGVGVFDTDERAYAVLVHVDAAGKVVFTDTVTNST